MCIKVHKNPVLVLETKFHVVRWSFLFLFYRRKNPEREVCPLDIFLRGRQSC